jgi:hypothetical protein
MMLAGSHHFRQPLGGHIHFSGPGVYDVKKITMCLDAHLALPLMMLENRASANARRTRYDYGSLGSIRTGKEHGGWEYRTLPSWLVSYQMTKMVLEISYMIAYDYERLLDSKGMTFINPYGSTFSSQFAGANKEELIDKALIAVEKLKLCPNAPKVMNSILTLENAVRMHLMWGQQYDATTRWHLDAKNELLPLPLLKQQWAVTSQDLSNTIYGDGRNIACVDIAGRLRETFQYNHLQMKYYIYGILNRYGYGFSCSAYVDTYAANLGARIISERTYGRARDLSPDPQAILIGVSREYRDNPRAAASVIAAIIRYLEGIH